MVMGTGIVNVNVMVSVVIVYNEVKHRAEKNDHVMVVHI